MDLYYIMESIVIPVPRNLANFAKLIIPIQLRMNGRPFAYANLYVERQRSVRN